MTLERFFELFEEELRLFPQLTNYHRFINTPDLYHFRKSYLVERYEFMLSHITKPGSVILDLGCGYGTTAILLTMLGHKVHGITLEYYFDEIEKRLEYWSRFGDVSSLKFEYLDFFDLDESCRYDYILAIDTLHHIEPFSVAATRLYNLLHPQGKLVVSEENGNNLIARMKHFRERGFKRISRYYDERLQKEIVFGNENTRSLAAWKRAFSHTQFVFDENSVGYIRFYMPRKHRKMENHLLIETEHTLWKKYSFLREYFFFGFNFVMYRK
jgi:2-polyprenyl-3-methyl-5-hydroxy-6-metoxy-1,4-benzoquinol methylase